MIARRILLSTSILAGAVFALTTQAQAQSAPASSAPAAIDELVVTGSRIARPNLDQPTPISTISQKLIRDAGPQSLGDIISQLPAVSFSGTLRANSNNFGNGAGISSINLRDLGLSRTLVLVDGERHVAGDITTNAVDVNSIPSALVDRVEVMTGGASAIYGSDAVTGVVNILLKKKFEGVEAEAELGGDDGGYGQKYSASVTAGRSFMDDRLNVVVTGAWSKEAGVDARNLPAAHNYGRIVNPNDIAPGTFDPNFYKSGSPIRNDGIPDRLYVPNVGSDTASVNGVLINPNNGRPMFSFNDAGQLIPVPKRTGFNSAGFGQLPANCGASCYFSEDYLQLASPFESKGVNFRVNYEVTPHMRAFLDAKFVQTNTTNTIQPSYSINQYQLAPDNAFIAPDLRAALAGMAPEDYPLIAKFLNPGRTTEGRRNTYRFVAGLKGDIDAGIAAINWDATINYGQTDSRFTNRGMQINENFAAALDSVIDPATGKAACRINVASAPQTGQGAGAFNKAACVPFNPFGQLNSAAVYGYSFGSYDTNNKLSQQVASLNFNTDSRRFFEFQGGALGLAAGAEYRMERTHETNDPFVLAGNTENLAANSSGGYNVYEGYVEVSAPIFKNYRPGLSELTLDAAYRGAHYSTVGDVSAYKFSGVYGPVSWIKLRTTYSRAIRAPNITEAFLPLTSTYFNIVDPCSAENIQANVNYAKNCQAAGLPQNFVANTNASIQGANSGNPGLEPEKSISYTGGIVIQPPIVPNLAITIDYYAIKIKNAITLINEQDVLNNCYGSSSGLDAHYCSLLTRGADHNINFLSTTYVNASKLETDGLDIQVSYAANVSGLTSRWERTQWMTGKLSFDMNVNYLFHLREFPFQSNPSQVHIDEGRINSVTGRINPHWKGLASLSYQQSGLTLTWQTRYMGRAALFDRDATAQDHSESLNIPFAEGVFYHNLIARYDFGDQAFGGHLKGAQVYGGVNNLFGEEPPFTLIGTGGDMGYDLGRFLFVGLKVRR